MNLPQNRTSWQGMGDLQHALKALPEDMRTRTLEAGMKALVEPVKVAAKRFAKRSEDTGALRESITTKVINYPQNGKCVGLIGPDKNYYQRGKKVKNLGALFATKRHRPANYAHLIEFGHIIAKGGSLRPQYSLELVETGTYSSKGKALKRWSRGAIKTRAKGTAGGFVAPRPFLRPAVATTMGAQSTAFAAGLENGFNAALKREMKTGRHIQFSV